MFQANCLVRIILSKWHGKASDWEVLGAIHTYVIPGLCLNYDLLKLALVTVALLLGAERLEEDTGFSFL